MVGTEIQCEGTDELVVAPSEWKPRWIVETPGKSEAGIAVDDRCFVVLVPDEFGHWRLTNHIPDVVVRKMAELSKEGVLSG